MGGTAGRALLHRPQRPPPPGRGPVHPRRLRRPRPGDHLRAGRRGRLARPRRRPAPGCRRGGRARVPDYADVLASEPPTALDDEAEGREMLYSSGTTGVPKGVRKPLGVTVPGDPRATSVAIALGIGAMGITGSSVYLSPAPLYHSAPARLHHGHAPPRRHRRGHGVLRRRRLPRGHRALPGHPRPVRAHHVHPDAPAARGAAPGLRRVEPPLRRPRRRPCPVPVKHRMLEWWGPIIYEYYAGTEDLGSSFITPGEWLEHPGSVGRPRDELHIVGDDGEELPAGQPGTIYFAGGRDSSTTTTPTRRRRSGTSTAGGRSATSATSTTTATST